MINVIERIRAAAVDPELREAARVHWARQAPLLFEDQPRKGLRVSDAGNCVRKVWDEVQHGKHPFEPQVQLFNLDDGTMTGLWWACLLAVSLEAEGYAVELEPEVAHEGVPGHIDLSFARHFHRNCSGEVTLDERGVVEFKKTGSWKAQPQRWHVLQLMTYCAAKEIEDGCVVTIAPNAKGEKATETWYKLSEHRAEIDAEWKRLSAALGPVEPVEDAVEDFRCRGCAVVACVRNPEFQPDTAALLEASLHG